VTSLPDWLVERAALDELTPENRARLDGADPRELADKIAALRADNDAELAGYPPGPAIAQIESRLAHTRRHTDQRRRRRWSLIGMATTAAAALVIVLVVSRPGEPDIIAPAGHGDDVRVKGAARLLAFRQAGDHAEPLEPDATVRAGDVIQLRYNAGGHGYGVIASLDGAGVVTLHYPVNESAPAEATAVSPKTTSLPNAYALDDAPGFERFFIITADEPIDLGLCMASLRALAHRADSADAPLRLPSGFHQWSLRLKKGSP
jgi:hypothetical protein